MTPTPEERVRAWTRERGGVPAWVADVTPGLVAMVCAAVLAERARCASIARAPRAGWLPTDYLRRDEGEAIAAEIERGAE